MSWNFTVVFNECKQSHSWKFGCCQLTLRIIIIIIIIIVRVYHRRRCLKDSTVNFCKPQGPQHTYYYLDVIIVPRLPRGNNSTGKEGAGKWDEVHFKWQKLPGE